MRAGGGVDREPSRRSWRTRPSRLRAVCGVEDMASFGLTRAAALDHAGDGERINAVGPGFIDTPLNDVHSAETKQAITGAIRSVAGARDEVAELVVWLPAMCRRVRDGQLLPDRRRVPRPVRSAAAAAAASVQRPRYRALPGPSRRNEATALRRSSVANSGPDSSGTSASAARAPSLDGRAARAPSWRRGAGGTARRARRGRAPARRTPVRPHAVDDVPALERRGVEQLPV